MHSMSWMWARAVATLYHEKKAFLDQCSFFLFSRHAIFWIVTVEKKNK